MISIANIKRACLADLLAQVDTDDSERAVSALLQFFKAPDFYVQNSRLGFNIGVDKQTGTPCFLLDLEAARKLVRLLEQQLGHSLTGVTALVEAGVAKQPVKYDKLQEVNVANEAQFNGIVNTFPKLSRQSKSQAMYDQVRTQLVSATELSLPISKAEVQTLSSADNRRRGQTRPRISMFLALDFEWWEKSSETILEVGWSLWDTLTQRHRTRHWIIRENLNKHNGGYISDNRMNFLFGTSERGGLERAFDALQAELDAFGVTDGLTRQQKDLLEGCDITMVLVGHAMTQDQEHAELYEIEWPEGMVTFDTQKLFTAYQLEQMDTEAAAAALQHVLSRRSQGAASKAVTLELVDQYEEDQDEPEDQDDEPEEDLNSDDSDYGLPGAVTSLSLAKITKGKSASTSSNSSGGPIAAVQPAKRKAVQGPVRVRPWPAGPLPSEREEKAGKDDAKQQNKIHRQIGLGPMLAELKIKGQRLHNAGNDARFTMEAFLAVTGHPVCADPAAAHANALLHDPRYKQQLEASMQAAAAQGWGAPVSPRDTMKGSCNPAAANGTAGASAAVREPSAWGSSAPAAKAQPQKSAWGQPVRLQDPAPTATSTPGGNQGQTANGARGGWAAVAASGTNAWAKHSLNAAQPAAAAQQGRKNDKPYVPPSRYEPTEDSW